MPDTGKLIRNSTEPFPVESSTFSEALTNGALLSSLLFSYDPLKYECGTAMLFLELYFDHKRVSLEELYDKAMSRSRGRRSSA